MTDEQIIDIILNDLRDNSPLNLITDILAPKKIWSEDKEHRIKNILSLMTKNNQVEIINGDKFFPATDIRLKMALGIDKRKEILTHLLNSDTFIDLRPLIKSLAMTRTEIIKMFSELEDSNILKSDNEWRQFTIITAGVEKKVEEIPFNFCLTTKGEEFVMARYMHQSIIQHGPVFNTGSHATINSNVVSQSQDVTINQTNSEISNTIENIKREILKDTTVDEAKTKEILDCLNEIQESIKNNKVPKYAIRSLIDLTGSISSISSWTMTLGQYAGLFPLG